MPTGCAGVVFTEGLVTVRSLRLACCHSLQATRENFPRDMQWGQALQLVRDGRAVWG